MAEAARKTDMSHCPNDSHGNPCCPHDVIGPATEGSDDVFINGLEALRLGDKGEHAECCGPNEWECDHGSDTVFINGKPAVRKGDVTKHCGGVGEIVDGSDNVFIG